MIVYRVTNTKNGKSYIGQTKQSLSRRWIEHCQINRSCCRGLREAIQKYGKENFTIEQIDVASNREEASIKESYWISFYNSMSPNGYNLQSGGMNNFQVCEETKLRVGDSTRGKCHSEETKRKISQGNLGKKLTLETRMKISKARIGSSRTLESRLKQSESISGAKNHRAISVKCVETGKVYSYIKQVELETGIHRTSVGACLKGKLKSAGGFHWEYDNSN